MIKLFQLALPLIMINCVSYGRSAWVPGGNNSKQNQSGDSNRRNVKNQNSNGYNEREQSRRVNRRRDLGSKEAYVVDGEIEDTHPVYHSVINYNNDYHTTKNKKQKEKKEALIVAAPVAYSPFVAISLVDAAKKDKEENMTQTNAELAKELKDQHSVKDTEKEFYYNIENVMAEDNRRRLFPDKRELEAIKAQDEAYHDYHPNMITGKQYRQDEEAAAFLSTASPQYRHEAMNDPKKAIKQATKLGPNMRAYTMDAKEANYYLTRSSREKDVEYMLAAFIISKDLDRYARRHPEKFIRDVLEGKKYRAFVVPVAKNVEDIKDVNKHDIYDIHSFIKKYWRNAYRVFNFHKFAEFLKERAERIMVIRTVVQTTLYGVRKVVGKLRKGKGDGDISKEALESETENNAEAAEKLKVDADYDVEKGKRKASEDLQIKKREAKSGEEEKKDEIEGEERSLGDSAEEGADGLGTKGEEINNQVVKVGADGKKTQRVARKEVDYGEGGSGDLLGGSAEMDAELLGEDGAEDSLLLL